MSESQFEYWKYTHLTIDVVPGRGAGFSVEGPTGMRFLIRSRMLDDGRTRELRPGPRVIGADPVPLRAGLGSVTKRSLDCPDATRED